MARIVTLGSRRGAYGGPWSTASRQCETLMRAGHHPVLVFGHLHGDAPETIVPGVTARVQRWVPLGRFSGLLSLRLTARMLWAVRKADIVHVSLARDLIPLIGSVMAVAVGRPLIVQTHGMLGSSRGRFARVADILIRHILERAKVIICLTETEARQLAQQFRNGLPFRIMGNATPDELLRWNPDQNNVDHPEVLFMARVNKRKRPMVFVTAASQSKQVVPHARWVIVGPDGGQLASVLEHNAYLGHPVEYQPPVAPNRVFSRLNKCAVFVLPADSEPWGNVLVAAMTLGIPVVLTESSALAPEVSAASAGVIVADNDPAALASAVTELLQDPGVRNEIGANGRALARRAFVDSALRDGLLAAYVEASR